MWWHVFNPRTWAEEKLDLCKSKARLVIEFWANQGYMERPCLNKKKRKEKTKQKQKL